MIGFTIFGDSSFASGEHSQSGFTIHLTYHDVRHLVHWQFLREQKIAESSAESELYALAIARKAARNMRLLLHESFTSSLHCHDGGTRVEDLFIQRQQRSIRSREISERQCNMFRSAPLIQKNLVIMIR